MKTTWLSTNTNMRWHWNLAQQEMTIILSPVSCLRVGIGRSDYYFIVFDTFNYCFFSADQTPTPTRFLKNCEEVGLFNELASPFDHDFKKAAEDDIKKVALVVKPFCLISVRSFAELFLFSPLCSYLWICHLLLHPLYATKLRNPQL